MKRLLALLVAAAMLVSLCACGAAPVETTVPPTTTEPAPPASELYAEANEKLAAMTNVQLDITYLEEMVLGADTFKSTTQEIVTFLDRGLETFRASTEGTCYSGSYFTEHSEQFLDGMYYGRINTDCFKAEMTAEEVQDRLLPVQLLDPGLYTSIEQTAEGEFIFTGSEILESWVDNNYTILTEATGTATLNENGVPSKFTYKATYTQGAADMTISVTVKVTEAPAGAVVEAPQKADSFQLLDTPDGPALVHMVMGNLIQATAVSSTNTEAVVIQAANFSEVQQIDLHTYGKVATQMMKCDVNYQSTANGKTDTYTSTDTYIDGILTSQENNGPAVTDSTIMTTAIESFIDERVFAQMPNLDYVADYDLTFVGDTLLLEYTFTDEVGESMRDDLSESYLGDRDLITELSSDYETTTMSGYIGIDASTGMPLSAAQTYLATHTVDGQEFLLSWVNQQKLQLGNLQTRDAILGEPLPPEEPQEKASPVFYKVTGAEGQQMWLLGTIHVGDERTAFLPQEIYDAFDASDALAVEFETESYTAQLMEDQEAMQRYIQAFLYTDGTTTKDHIADEALYEQLLKFLQASGTYDNTMLVTKPVFLDQTISSFFMSNGYRLSSDFGVDNQLQARAYEQEKEILSVESGEFQMDLLGAFSDELQILMLRDTLEYGQCAYNYHTEQLFELWCQGDEAALIEYLNREAEEDPDMTEEEKALMLEYEQAMETGRNVDMLAVAEEYLGSGKTVFYAVGLAHLLADDGLVNTLRNAGYTVELVRYAG